MIRQISIKTKFGWISAFEEKEKIIKIQFGKCKNKRISKNLKKFKKYLHDFFSGKTNCIQSSIILKGNSNQLRVWRELKNIKFGKTKTYGEIAKKYNLSPRYVGKICSQNNFPLVIPCHRVIRSDGNLGGFSAPGGIKLKKKLLNFEKN